MEQHPTPLNYAPYLEAIGKERLARDASVLGVNESVGDFEVVPLNLWHLTVLRVMKHPLLFGGDCTETDLFNFLWLVSPDYGPKNALGKSMFLRRCRIKFFPPRYLALFNTPRARTRHLTKRLKKRNEALNVIRSAIEYLNEALQDRPATQARRGFEPDYYSDGIAFCATFARELHFSEDHTMHMPLKRVFQYLNEMKVAVGSKVPLCNPSDSVKAEFYRQLNRDLGRDQKNKNLREITARLKAERKANKRKNL